MMSGAFKSFGCGGFSDGVLAAGRAGSVSEIKTFRR
jgi:hypothetical protein